MAKGTMGNGIRISVLAGVFAAGFLSGAWSQHPADAQLGEVGKAAGKAAVGSAVDSAVGESGALGAVAKLGSTIGDLEGHVKGLQQNLDTLKAVQSALGG
jgi:hypothetical protein